MDLDSIEAGLLRMPCSLFIVAQDARDFRELKRAGLGHFGETLLKIGFRIGANAGGRDRGPALRLQRRMRDAADMPELDEDASTGPVNGIGNLAPPGDLFRCVDTRCAQIA